MKHVLSILLIFSTSLFGCNDPSPKKVELKNPSINIESTRIKAKQALKFCKAKKFNEDFCILIDMNLHSGVKRFIVWDYKKNKISNSYLVGHGCGDNPWNNDFSKGNPKFSNIDGSHYSSLGKYKIGKRAHSDWGVNVKYFLHGLESTNSNAFKRFIVFHSWEVVSDEEIYPNGTPEGWGCPTISNNSFKIIDSLLKSSSKHVLMWIYK